MLTSQNYISTTHKEKETLKKIPQEISDEAMLITHRLHTIDENTEGS